ncbi:MULTISPECIES: hypothetical protein [Jannaschia]|nr:MULTISPECIES: hypothetical protein [unclassified Jannaschia]
MKHVVMILVGGALVAFLFWRLWAPDVDVSLCEADPTVCPCMRILPEDRQLGIKFSVDNGKLTELEFGGSRAQGEAPSADLAEKFVQCIERVRKDAVVKNFSKLNTSPIGQIANQWLRNNGPQITLRPQNEEEIPIINNLQIGPTSGVRWKILEEWCSGEMSDCVECSDTLAGEQTVAVEVRLRENAPVFREFWSDDWPIVDPKRKAWELVDNEGKRYLYACRSQE